MKYSNDKTIKERLTSILKEVGLSNLRKIVL